MRWMLSVLFVSCYLHTPTEEPTTLAPLTPIEVSPSSAPAASLALSNAPAPGAIRSKASIYFIWEEQDSAGGLHVAFSSSDGKFIGHAHHGGDDYHPAQPFCIGDIYLVDYIADEFSSPIGKMSGRAKPITKLQGNDSNRPCSH